MMKKKPDHNYFDKFRTDAKTACPRCGKLQTNLVALTDQGRMTFNKIQVCQNKNCPLFIEVSGLKKWTMFQEKNFWRNFRRQNAENYNPNRKGQQQLKNALENGQTTLCCCF